MYVHSQSNILDGAVLDAMCENNAFHLTPKLFCFVSTNKKGFAQSPNTVDFTMQNVSATKSQMLRSSICGCFYMHVRVSFFALFLQCTAQPPPSPTVVFWGLLGPLGALVGPLATS